MKARNKNEKYIEEFINPLVDDDYIKNINVVSFPYFQNKTEHKNNVYVCGNCGKTVDCSNNMKKCPYCDCELEENLTRKRTCKKWKFYFKTEIIKDYQVIRYFEFNCLLQKGKKALIDKNEIGRVFVKENKKGKLDISVMSLPMYTVYYDLRFRYGFPFTFCKADKFVRMFPRTRCELIDKLKLTKDIKKRGYCYNKHITLNMLDYLIDSQKVDFLETLYKLKQFNLINSYYSSLRTSLIEYKKELLLMIRWGKQFEKHFDYNLFVDYIQLAKKCGFDTKTKKILLFKDLKKEHDKMDKLNKLNLVKEEMKLIKREQVNYLIEKEKYFNLDLGEKDVKIIVIKSVNDFKNTGKELNHCVYSNEYYNKKSSLIFNCYFKDKLYETAEIDIKSLNLIQLRGNHNADSEHHKMFKDLIEKNKKLIKKVA